MAYEATVTQTYRGLQGGRRVYVYTVTETDCAGTSEYSMTVPKQGRVVSCKATKTAGDGATIAPTFGPATGVAANTQARTHAYSASAHVNDRTAIPYVATAGLLYVRSTPASGSNNAVTTEWVVVDGVV
ncbi:MAG TPA: hypothetical protein VEI97_14645 [bacterium]|nr:hypothetical protein [bacterium]